MSINQSKFYLFDGSFQAFVSCSMGPNIVAGSLIGMGLMQLIVSCTLSMLLKHTKRYAVLGKYNFIPSSISTVDGISGDDNAVQVQYYCNVDLVFYFTI